MIKKQASKTPRSKPRKALEKKAQAECFQWAWNHRKETRGLLASIENEEGGGVGKIMQRKAAGLLPGFADMVLLMARNERHGLFIELKTPDGKQSPAQKTFQENVERQGYQYEIAIVLPGAIEAFKEIIDKYLGNY